MTIGKLSGQCDFGQKGQSYCNQRGQSCVAKRVKVAWLFHLVPLYGLFQLPYQISCLVLVLFNAFCITMYDDVGN